MVHFLAASVATVSPVRPVAQASPVGASIAPGSLACCSSSWTSCSCLSHLWLRLVKYQVALVGPVAAVFLVAPVGRVSPVSPMAPVSPVGPVAFVLPVAPGDAFGPVPPVTSLAPVLVQLAWSLQQDLRTMTRRPKRSKSSVKTAILHYYCFPELSKQGVKDKQTK
jgi:hypothetical protein